MLGMARALSFLLIATGALGAVDYPGPALRWAGANLDSLRAAALVIPPHHTHGGGVAARRFKIPGLVNSRVVLAP